MRESAYPIQTGLVRIQSRLRKISEKQERGDQLDENCSLPERRKDP